jgi:glycosyltransferase involved in cell wall biosynthesis
MKEAILNKIHCSADQVKLVFNGIFRDNSEKKKSQYPGKPVQIIFAGGNNRTKGADVVFSVAIKMSHMKIKDYQINWIGHLTERGKYSKNNLDSIPNVCAFGYIPNDRLQEILTEADILLMPSRAEGCPMLLLEAMSKGMVIIVSDCPSAMKEIVSAANAGFVISAGSSKELLEALTELIKSNTKRKLMSENAVKFYKKNLTMDCCGGKIEELCRKPRLGRIAKKEDFPPQFFIPYHRRPYPKGSLFKLTSVMQRICFIFGRLPPRRHINI